MIKEYRDFVVSHFRFVSFGFVFAAASSFGQTYFIGVFGPEIQAEFQLSHTEWGVTYLVGTLASALVLPWTGRYIDRMRLSRYSFLVLALMVLSCLMAAATPTALFLIFTIFLLRQSGQGLMSHVAITSMGRYFESHRGRAIAVATLGFAAAEAVLPYLAVLLIAAIGWRFTYASCALLLVVAVVPLVSLMLRGHDSSAGDKEKISPSDDREPQRLAVPLDPNRRSWTLSEFIKDRRFLLMLPGLTAPSAIITALFFHHLNIATAKGWSAGWITGSYGIYALFVTFASLICGPSIDRIGAVRLVAFMLVPLILALLVLAGFNNAWYAWLYLALVGIHTGVAHTAVTAMWAELYGVVHLGAIKSFATAVSVFASAIGPVSVGALFDLNWSVAKICVYLSAYTAVACLLLMYALRPQAPR